MIQKQKHEPECGTVYKNIPKKIAVCAATLALIIPSAFAANAPEGVEDMFQAINSAWKLLCGIFAIGAVLSIASYAFAFFGITGTRDDEKKITRCKKQMITVLIATACMFLIPTAVNFGRDIAGNLTWNPEGSESNHIITPKDPSEEDTLENAVERGLYAYPPVTIDRETLNCAGCDYLDRECVPCAHCIRAAGYADYYKPQEVSE